MSWHKRTYLLGDYPNSSGTYKVKNAPSGLNIRKEPSVTAAIVGKLNNGDTGKVIALSNDLNWAHIDKGYINGEYIDFVKDAKEVATQPYVEKPGFYPEYKQPAPQKKSGINPLVIGSVAAFGLVGAYVLIQTLKRGKE